MAKASTGEEIPGSQRDVGDRDGAAVEGAREAATFTLEAKQLRGVMRPVLHVLTTGGRMDEFRDRGGVVTEDSADPADSVVRAQLVNGRNEPYYTPDGQLAIVDIPVVHFGGILPDPDRWLSLKEMAKRVGVSESTAERMVKRGALPQSVKLSERRNGYRQGEVDEAVARLGKRT